ncbi:MAG: hypothetical protein RLZZ04_1895 [Cyanobacteriota bacterium]|jgi:3-oxoacyl-[acyl-carrier-protein] synthase II
MGQLSKPLAITGWDIISSIGIGREAFVENFSRKYSGLKLINRDKEANFPIEQAFTIPEFDTVKFLGSRGARNLNKSTAMTMATVGMAIEHSSISDKAEQEQLGVVLGTSNCSLKSIADFTRETYVYEKPHFVNPAHFPNCVLNCAAGNSAIKFKLKGVNATISGRQLSAFLAFRYAGLKIRQGYVNTLVTGAVEEFSEQSAWNYYHAHKDFLQQKSRPGEGCAMFVVEDPKVAVANGRKILAEILACEVGVYPEGRNTGQIGQAEGLKNCICKTLERTNTSSKDIWAISKHQTGLPKLNEIQDLGINLALQDAEPLYNFSIGDLLGDCFSASGAFQIAALLALPNTESIERKVLATSVTSDGAVGCILINIKGC